jgi:hypothetical protein
MKVFNTASLREERERLRIKILHSEQDFHLGLSLAEKNFGPVARFFFPKRDPENPANDQNDWFHRGARILIPFLVDRVTLGTRGLFINRGLNAGLQFLAGKVSGQKVSTFFQDLLYFGLDKMKWGKKEKNPSV